jgi:ribosomal protein L37E
MVIETIGEKCPCCGFDRVLHNYGDKEYFQFDACAVCGFGSGGYVLLRDAKWQSKFVRGEELWGILEFIYGYTRHELFEEVKKYDIDSEAEMVFSYSQDDVDFHKSIKMPVY